MARGKSRVVFIDPPKDIVLDEILRVLEVLVLSKGRTLGKLVYHFVSREKIREVNRKFLQHDYYTDIITFDYSKGSAIEGDLFICTEVVNENAIDLKTEGLPELYRVVFHGVLHILGFNDQTLEERTEMRNRENECLKMLENVGE